MAVTYSATPMGAYRSAVRNVLLSVAAAGTETLTLVHRLGACPHEIRVALRSCCATVSGIPLPTPAITSLNMSQAVMDISAGGARTRLSSGYVDIIAEFTHSIVQ